MGLQLKQFVSPLAIALAMTVTSAGVLYAQNDQPSAQPPANAAPQEQPAPVEASKSEQPAETAPAAEVKAAPEAPVQPEDAKSVPAADEAPAAPAAEEAKKAEKPAKTDDGAKTAHIYEPTNAIEKAAQDVLNKHCARCHQDGALTGRDTPAKDFGNVLDMKAMAQTPSLVLPGNPDGSKLYTQIVNEEMPYDLFNEQDYDQPTPTEGDLLALRKWIESLGATAAAACETRKFADNQAVVKTISDDLNSLKDHRLEGTRYITLTHLYNSCATDEEMKVFRQGVVKLLNSLSQNSDVLKLKTIDEAGTIIRFNLDDVRWTSKQWDQLLAAYPYGSKPDTNLMTFLTSTTKTALPMIRGDWFAFTASRPPLYHDLLKLPKTFQGLAKELNVDIEDNIKKFLVQRAGFQKSGVSVNNRLIERHTTSFGMFWTSYDFAGNRGRQSLFDHPMGPKGKNAFKADGGETIYSLPNGFQAYYLNTETGKQLDKGPISIVRDPSRRDQSVTNGISCFGCHDQGIRKAKDDIRQHVLKDRSFPKRVRDAVDAMYPTHDVMDKVLDQDRERFQSAMRRAGLDPTLKLNGVEMINALSNRYEQNVDIRLAAAEFGLEKDAFLEAMAQAGSKAFALKRRLEQGLVPRDQFEGFYAKLVQRVNDEELINTAALKVKGLKVAKVNTAPLKLSHNFDIALISDKSVYKVNELPVFTVTSKADCHLNLINVDKTGEATVIFPNKFQQRNLIRAGKTLEFPGPKAPFQFRLKDPGTETVIAVCNATGKDVDGVKHKFRSAAFTELGNYGKHLTRKIVVEAAKVKSLKGKTGRKAKNAKKILAGKRKILARTAIKIEVR